MNDATMKRGRTLLVSDIHGCYQTFRALIEDTWKLTTDDELYILGDYIDRGSHSKQVVDYILQLRHNGFPIHTLKGNHEDLMLQAMDDEVALKNWLANGGVTTLESFGIKHPSDMPQVYQQFFRELDYYLEVEDAFLVHAGFDFSKDDPFSDYQAMLWIRGFETDRQQLNNKRLIHGHTPISKEAILETIEQDTDAINIDAGCVYDYLPNLGRLCGLNLDTMEPVFQKNQEQQ